MRRLAAMVFLVCFFLVGAAARAQPKDDGWEKVDGSMTSPGEVIPANRLVGAAYGFIFAALVVWVASVAARTRRVEDEIESLRKKIHEKK